MPRQARIDAPGALHHIIIRGNERRDIFCDETDCGDFIRRFGHILIDTGTACYAWALLTNHVHLLLRTGSVSLATVMKRLLTGYAQQFNRRYGRVGHLFQNRYKSILCEEDPYFLELVRYIHLNPLRAGMVDTLYQLSRYPWCGHGYLLGTFTNTWQDSDYVLAQFGKTQKQAQKQYLSFINDGFNQGQRLELTGGGLVRSYGGWQVVKEHLKKGVRVKGDERILGSSSFVERVLKQAEERMEQKAQFVRNGIGIDQILKRVSEYYGFDASDLLSASRNRRISEARALVCYGAVRVAGFSGQHVASCLQISPSAVCKAANRGSYSFRKLRLKDDFFE
jgi:REP element-mobilizing transposase RayT